MPNYKIEIADTVESAVQDSDVICTVTASKEPLFSHNNLKPGCHINAVGASKHLFVSLSLKSLLGTPVARELSSDTMVNALVFTDRKESLVNEAGDFVIPLNEGKFDESHLKGELSDLVLKKVEGKRKVNE